MSFGTSSYGSERYGGAAASSPNADVQGVVTTIAVAAPAGVAGPNVSVAGVVATISVAAPRGFVDNGGAWIAAEQDVVAQLYTLDQIGATKSEASEVWQPTVATGDVSVAGPVASITAAAPAGTLLVDSTVAGVVTSVTVASPTGVVEVAAVGVATSIAVASPSGAASGDATTTGVVTSVTVTAPAGTASGSGSVSVDGVVASITVAAPAGAVSADSSVTVAPPSITAASPAGSADVAEPGTVTTVTVSAPAGTTSGTAEVTTAPVAITVTAPAGTAVGTLDATVTGVVVSITASAPAGIVEVAAVGVAGAITVTAPAGTVTATGPTVAPPTVTVAAPAGVVFVNSTVGPGLDPGSPSVGPGGPPDTVEGPMLAVTVTARAGTVTGVNVPPVPGVLLTAAVSAPAGEVEALSVDRSAAGIQLTLLTEHVAYQPGVVRLSVIDERDPELRYFPEEGVWLFLDDEQVSTFEVELDPDTFDNEKVLFPVDDLTVGAHTITAGHWYTARDERTTVTFYADTAQATTGATTPQYPPAITSGRWTFQQYDFASLGSVLTYEFPINPSELRETYAEPAITTDSTTAYDGTMVIWEGERRPDRWVISGEVLERIDHDALAYWAAINQRLWVTDEYGRTILAKIVGFKAVRKKAMEYPWRHQYTMTFDVLDGPSVPTFSGEFAGV